MCFILNGWPGGQGWFGWGWPEGGFSVVPSTTQVAIRAPLATPCSPVSSLIPGLYEGFGPGFGLLSKQSPVKNDKGDAEVDDQPRHVHERGDERRRRTRRIEAQAAQDEGEH